MSLDPDLEEMRRLGHQAVDRAVEHLAGLRGKRVVTPPRRDELEPLVAEPLPETGLGLEDSLQRFFGDLLPCATLVNHPRFFAYIPGPGSFTGAVGEWVAAATNTFVGTWLGGAVMAQLEVQTVDWLRAAVGLPEPRVGMVTTGGSMANLGGLAAGLVGHDRQAAVVYVGEQGHYSLAKAAKVLGIAAERIRAVPDGDDQCMDPASLRRMLAEDRARGLKPAVVTATCGTTNTGSIDPVAELADLCRSEGLWLHCDAAYGGAVALLEDHRPLLRGWEQADSVTLDPHKWFYTPFECGCLLVRDGSNLRAAFGGDGAYMQDIPRDETNFFAMGPELTRGARALKLWFVLRSHGTRALADCIRRDIEHARLAADRLAADPRIEILTPPRLSILTFGIRSADGGDETARRLTSRLMQDGFVMLSSTLVGGRYAIRFCVANHRTTAQDVEDSVAAIRQALDLVRS